MNDVDIKALLGNRAVLWQEEAACGGDSRFTANIKTLTCSDIHEMRAKCASCPVREQCRKLAEDTNAIEVFMAGVWLPDPAEVWQQWNETGQGKTVDPDGLPYEATTLDNPS